MQVSPKQEQRIYARAIDRLMVFLPLFDVAGRTFVVPGPDGEPDLRTLHTLPYSAFEDYALAFRKVLADPVWQTPARDPDRAAEMVFCACDVARADLDEVLDMLRWIAAYDRSQKGDFIRIIVEDGRLTSILKRLSELRRDLPDA